jgi:hypothetical protein
MGSAAEVGPVVADGNHPACTIGGIRQPRLVRCEFDGLY